MQHTKLKAKTKLVNGQRIDIATGQPYGGGFTEAPGAPASKPTKSLVPTSASKAKNYRYTTPEEYGLSYYRGQDRDFTEQDAETIRRDTATRLQPQIDAIEGVYAGLFKQEEQQGLERIGRTRAIGARGGLLGSARGEGQKNKTGEYNQQLINNLQAKKAQDIGIVLGEIDARARKSIEAKQAEVRGNAESYIKFLGESRDAARENLKTLASGGVALADLAPEDINDLVEQGNFGSKTMMEAFFNSNKPKELQTKYSYDVRRDGTVIKTGDDGTFEVTDIKVPPEVDSQIFSADNGDLLYIDKNTGEYKSLGNFAKPETSNLTPSEREKQEKERVANVDQQTLAIQSAKDKIAMIDGLITSKGMAKAVGPSAFGRWTPFTADTWTGETQDFVAGVNQLISKETLDGLLQLKAGGGTLGALSDQERIMLQNAATKIGSYQIKDAQGNPTGKFNASESSFKKELETIKTLAQRALERAEKKVLSPDEQKELDQEFGDFDPSQYF